LKMFLFYSVRMESYGETVRIRLENLINNVKNIRSRKELIDVTLVGDDGVQIGAHMIMLSACSTFFQNIFVNMKHRHPMLYLRGMESPNISAVLDFIYTGEVQVLQEHLQSFLCMAEDLGIQGLTSNSKPTSVTQNKIRTPAMKNNEESVKKNVTETQTKTKISDQNDLSGLIENFVDQFATKSEPLSMEELEAPSFHHGEIAPNGDFFSMPILNTAMTESIDKQIEEMVQTVEGFWGCKKCGKVMRKKQHIKNHAESHLVGYSHPCPYCDKHSKTRNALSNHISYFHKKAFPEGMLLM